MIEPEHRKLSIRKQCKLLKVSRTAYYYAPKPEDRKDIEEKIRLKELFLQIPFYGYRKMFKELKSEGYTTSPKRVRRLMREMGLRAVSPRKFTSIPNRQNPIYPYLLKGKKIRYPNQVWATDITYLKLDKGFAYLVAIMDIYSRKVLTWKISTTLDSEFCIAAVKEALAKYGTPAIFNTDQGCQFTSYAFLKPLHEAGVRISMDGQGSWRDNIYVERLWRSLKYEDIYLRSYENVRELKKGVQRYLNFYNRKRFHQGLDYLTPDDVYESFQVQKDYAA